MFKNLVGKKNFSIDRLATLCHVAEAGSIGSATGDNPNQQSQYSRQLAELEGEPVDEKDGIFEKVRDFFH